MSPDKDAGDRSPAIAWRGRIPGYAVILVTLGLLAILSWHRPDWLAGGPGRRALSVVIALALVGAAVSFGSARFIPVWGPAILMLLAAYGALAHAANLLRGTPPDLPTWLRGEVLAAVLVLPLAVLIQVAKVGIGWRQGTLAPGEARRGTALLLSLLIAVPGLSAVRGPISGEPLGKRRSFGSGLVR